MKKKANIYVLSLLSIIILLEIKLNQKLISQNIYLTFKLWLTIIIPNLYPILIITEYLFQNNIHLLFNNKIEIIFNKIFKYNKYSLIIIICSILCGSPTNTILIKYLYTNDYINLSNANKLLKNTCYINPLFLIYYLNKIIHNPLEKIIILIIYYSINFIFAIFEPIEYYKPPNIFIKKDKLINIITNKFTILINILSTLIITTIIITLCTIKIHNINLIILINGLLEITSGLNHLIIYQSPISSKLFLIIIIFNGIAIHFQIKSIIANTSLSYNAFLKDRIIKALIATTSFAILTKTIWYS